MGRAVVMVRATDGSRDRWFARPMVRVTFDNPLLIRAAI
jgi:hypothetical protein